MSVLMVQCSECGETFQASFFWWVHRWSHGNRNRKPIGLVK